jgi:hypothetical protein
MSEQNCIGHIANCQKYLTQGDIFKFDLVAPIADLEKRIFRTIDGKHSSLINSDGSNGRIFAYDELLAAIEDLPIQERLPPFQKTTDGKYERVLVYAELLKYFIILSQTCDISGVDSSPNPICTVVPIVTIGQYCQNQLPFSYEDPEIRQKVFQTISIADYVSEKFDPEFKSKVSDEFTFPDYLRENLKTWQDKAKKKPQKSAFLGTIRNALKLIVENKPLSIYYIAPDKEHNVPESYVDFCRVYIVSTNVIQDIRDKRIATLSVLYREEFAKKFANYYERIATPQPMRGQPI